MFPCKLFFVNELNAFIQLILIGLGCILRSDQFMGCQWVSVGGSF